MACQATVKNHCCWIPGVGVCPHFDPSLQVDHLSIKPTGGGFCSLMAELGDWDKVHSDPRYAPQRKAFLAFPTSLCGDFPSRAESPCVECGAVAD